MAVQLALVEGMFHVTRRALDRHGSGERIDPVGHQAEQAASESGSARNTARQLPSARAPLDTAGRAVPARPRARRSPGWPHSRCPTALDAQTPYRAAPEMARSRRGSRPCGGAQRSLRCLRWPEAARAGDSRFQSGLCPRPARCTRRATARPYSDSTAPSRRRTGSRLPASRRSHARRRVSRGCACHGRAQARPPGHPHR